MTFSELKSFLLKFIGQDGPAVGPGKYHNLAVQVTAADNNIVEKELNDRYRNKTKDGVRTSILGNAIAEFAFWYATNLGGYKEADMDTISLGSSKVTVMPKEVFRGYALPFFDARTEQETNAHRDAFIKLNRNVSEGMLAVAKTEDTVWFINTKIVPFKLPGAEDKSVTDHWARLQTPALRAPDGSACVFATKAVVFSSERKGLDGCSWITEDEFNRLSPVKRPEWLKGWVSQCTTRLINLAPSLVDSTKLTGELGKSGMVVVPLRKYKALYLKATGKRWVPGKPQLLVPSITLKLEKTETLSKLAKGPCVLPLWVLVHTLGCDARSMTPGISSQEFESSEYTDEARKELIARRANVALNTMQWVGSIEGVKEELIGTTAEDMIDELYTEEDSHREVFGAKKAINDLKGWFAAGMPWQFMALQLLMLLPRLISRRLRVKDEVFSAKVAGSFTWDDRYDVALPEIFRFPSCVRVPKSLKRWVSERGEYCELYVRGMVEKMGYIVMKRPPVINGSFTIPAERVRWLRKDITMQASDDFAEATTMDRDGDFGLGGILFKTIVKNIREYLNRMKEMRKKTDEMLNTLVAQLSPKMKDKLGIGTYNGVPDALAKPKQMALIENKGNHLLRVFYLADIISAAVGGYTNAVADAMVELSAQCPGHQLPRHIREAFHDAMRKYSEGAIQQKKHPEKSVPINGRALKALMYQILWGAGIITKEDNLELTSVNQYGKRQWKWVAFNAGERTLRKGPDLDAWIARYHAEAIENGVHPADAWPSYEEKLAFVSNAFFNVDGEGNRTPFQILPWSMAKNDRNSGVADILCSLDLSWLKTEKIEPARVAFLDRLKERMPKIVSVHNAWVVRRGIAAEIVFDDVSPFYKDGGLNLRKKHAGAQLVRHFLFGNAEDYVGKTDKDVSTIARAKGLPEVNVLAVASWFYHMALGKKKLTAMPWGFTWAELVAFRVLLEGGELPAAYLKEEVTPE